MTQNHDAVTADLAFQISARDQRRNIRRLAVAQALAGANTVVFYATGAIVGWPPGLTARIHYKVCDCGEYWLGDAAGNRIAKWAGDYVPSRFLCHGGEGYGDYIILTINGDGAIDGYRRPDVREGDWTLL